MNYAKGEDVASKKDEAVLANGITVLVDPKAVFYIAGTVMDFEVRLNHCELSMFDWNFRLINCFLASLSLPLCVRLAHLHMYCCCD